MTKLKITSDHKSHPADKFGDLESSDLFVFRYNIFELCLRLKGTQFCNLENGELCSSAGDVPVFRCHGRLVWELE